MRIEDLSQWIANDDARYAVVQENNSRETFVKMMRTSISFITREDIAKTAYPEIRRFTTVDCITSSTVWFMIYKIR